ncbi:MAG: hypothetical protein EZS28_001559 [Streblomastix strix]|uniref:Uncharacterized protein n=1 Tax=Streblomastix strix TaxID=222440 RepID=A0A5J4X6W2_9EUKA|nr:MAG: hypothetical protein EZS28_001559 [Streblomastix strix]
MGNQYQQTNDIVNRKVKRKREIEEEEEEENIADVPIQKTNPIPNKEDLSEEYTLEIAFEEEEEEEQIEIKRSEFQKDSHNNGSNGWKKKIYGNKQMKGRNI